MLTRDELKAMKADMILALKEVEKKHDVKIDLGNIVYDDFSFTVKTKVTKNEARTEEGEKLLFEKSCYFYGLKPNDYLYQFDANVKGKRQKFEVIGFELSRSKFPIKARNTSTGDVMLFTRDVVKDIAWGGNESQPS